MGWMGGGKGKKEEKKNACSPPPLVFFFPGRQRNPLIFTSQMEGGRPRCGCSGGHPPSFSVCNNLKRFGHRSAAKGEERGEREGANWGAAGG